MIWFWEYLKSGLIVYFMINKNIHYLLFFYSQKLYIDFHLQGFHFYSFSRPCTLESPFSVENVHHQNISYE